MYGSWIAFALVIILTLIAFPIAQNKSYKELNLIENHIDKLIEHYMNKTKEDDIINNMIECYTNKMKELKEESSWETELVRKVIPWLCVRLFILATLFTGFFLYNNFQLGK